MLPGALLADIVEGETSAISEARVVLEPAAPSGVATRDRARSAVTASPPADPVIAVAPEPATSTLADELAILRAGRRALAAGDAEGALEHVSSHTRRFPAGAMAEDRDRCLWNRVHRVRDERRQVTIGREGGRSRLAADALYQPGGEP